MADLNDTRTNDEAFSAEVAIVEQIAKLLDFDYWRFDTLGVAANDQLSLRPRSTRLFPKYIYRTLPHALGFSTWDGRIELVCVTDMSSDIFWEYVSEKLGLDSDTLTIPEDGRTTVNLRDVAELNTAESHISKLQLLYTRRPWSSFENYTGKLKSDQMVLREDQHLAKVFDCQDVHKLIEITDHSRRNRESDTYDFETLFRTGFLKLRKLASCAGILSGPLGLLTEEGLLHLYPTALVQAIDYQEQNLSSDSVLRIVLHYGTFQDPGMISVSLRDKLAIYTASGTNVFASITSEGTRAYFRALKTFESTSESPTEWIKTAKELFIAEHEWFIKLDARCWPPKMRPDFASALPDILLKLQTHIRKGGRRVFASIWPYHAEHIDAEGEYVYLLGAYRLNEELPVDAEYLEDLCQRYMDKLQFDPSTASVDLQVISAEDATTLLTDMNAPEDNIASSPGVGKTARTLRETTEPGAKLRTAASAMNRLRWDPVHSSTDYDVGYVDRFEKDLMWKSLDKWEKTTEEEEFIPEHRIQRIKRTEDSFVVWDREKKLDRTGKT